MPKHQFPKTFEWGTASASYQIEGAYREDGKGESIWDRFAHTAGKIIDGSTADVACDFYHRYPEDIAVLKQLGIQVYRLSVSWPRIFPAGTGELNPAGIDFYRRVLNELKQNGIKTAVTLYHWDLPQKLQDRGGWANREIAGWFADYARALYTGLGDLVDYWITLNEPFCVAFRSYWDGAHAPGYRDYSMALSAVHHQLMAHGAAVKAYRQTGLTAPIGITLNMNSMYPLDPANPADAAAANRLHLQSNRLFGDPVMKGSYPQELFDFLQTRGVVLPDIQPGDLELISQELDFFGLNNYYAEYVKADPAVWPLGCRAAKTGKPQTDAGWEVTPDGLYDLLVWIQEAYAPKQIIITENGAASNDFVNLDGKVADPVRQDYLRRYLIAVKQAIDSGVPVTGYYVWCFCDNFEWAWGLSRRFGIVYVDYKTQQRIPKESALWYARVIRDGGFD